MSLGLLRALLITDPLIILATACYGAVNLAVSFFDHDGSRQVAIAHAWSKALLRIAGVEVSVRGIEKIDTASNYVFVSNHLSYMDTPVVLSAIPVQFRFLAKKSLFKIPLLGYHLKRAGHLAVPRGNPREAVKTMSEAGRIIRERGVSVLIFPEGGRSPKGYLLPFKEGAAYIAIKAGVPVAPLCVTGTLEVLPTGSIHVRPGQAQIRIGDPIPTEHLTLADRGRLTLRMYDAIAGLLGSDFSPVPPPADGAGAHTGERR
ncbi:MAG: 1-acyl-sn-glycerol-3-phosphate acyltransferase [Acidobacteria bacterium]|nr:1-acyl-sn-glycerol-3-phosphate acyltransferase [Acidobacteriota bacterium]MBI3280320.1 1-acyl-sn-glycerol-3-phosphate acyltransferase [Acidobacteriota bacterium]